jgi:hypothetical protein
MTVLKASRAPEGLTTYSSTVTKNQASAASSLEPSTDRTTSNWLGWSRAARATPRHHLLPAIALLGNRSNIERIIIRA